MRGTPRSPDYCRARSVAARRRFDVVEMPHALLAEVVRRLGGPRAVAAQLGLSRPAVEHWVKRGTLPRHRLDALRELLFQQKREQGEGRAV